MNTSTTTGDVISSDKVEGTKVYNLAGDKLGSVDDLMINKHSGQVLCRSGVRWIPGHGDRPVSAALEHAQVRHGEGWLCRAAGQGEARKGSAVCGERPAGLHP